MSTEKDGGIAFPSVSALDENRGMSLRDYFAAKAMAVVLAADVKSVYNIQAVAAKAYEVADAMLAERAK